VGESLDKKYHFEFLFSDNHSSDDTWEKIHKLAVSDKRVKGIRFTRNIGFQESIMTNLTLASGNAMIQLDADLQDPPEMIADFLREWSNGHKVVYGIRISRGENRLVSSIRKLGYRIISRISEHPIPVDVGDFRLIDREVRDKLVQSKTPNPYIRGMIASFGIAEQGLEYSRAEREANKSKFPLKSIFKLGLDGILNHSSWPLRFSTYTGIYILIGSLFMSTYYLFLKVFNHDLPQGLASIHILVSFGIGMNALFLGIIGDYLNRIYTILRNEPRYIPEEYVNIMEKK
jgi:dolichol-phosphate mannosyltransferase